jgi:two-component system sensor histidine kinase YesM
MGKKSVQKLFVSVFMVMIVILSVLAVAFGLYAISDAERGITVAMRQELDRSIRQLEKDFGSISSFNRDIVANDTDFLILSLPRCTDAQRVVSEYNIRRIVLSRTPSYSATFLIDCVHDRALFFFGADMDYLTPAEKMDSKNVIQALVSEMPESEYGMWKMLECNGHVLAYHVNASRSLYLCSVVDLNEYLEYNQPALEQTYGEIVVYQDGKAIVNASALESRGLFTEDLKRAKTAQGTQIRNMFVYTEPIDFLHAGISLITPVSAIVSSLMPQIGFFVTLILLINIVTLLCYRFLKRVLCFPLQEIAAMSQHLEESVCQEEIQTKDKDTYVEFDQIRNALNNLLNQKVELELAKQKKEMAEEHAMLQYYQLQTRSHFFLNCLKSLYSMSEIGETGKMQMMISAFSAHMRYIFMDTLSLITLKEELKEVSDYHKIISADFPRPFLLYNDVPNELQTCKVPGLLLQTLLENTYKHNGKNSGTLLFQIAASKVETEGKIYLRIHVTDNGAGYTAQAINELNAEPVGDFDQYNVGINNLKRRMKIIFQGDCHIVFYNAPNCGAVTVIYLPFISEEARTERNPR